jgi:TonB family protein
MQRKKEFRLFFAIFLLLTVGAAAARQAVPEPLTGQTRPITEAGLKQLLAGKFVYLRNGYLDNSLSFDEHGLLIGHSPQGSYTLNIIQIDSLRLNRRKLEIHAVRYGLHFLGALPTEGPADAVDRVRITPRKKWMRITIARLRVVKPKKNKKGATHPPAAQTPDADTTTSPAFAATVLSKALDKVFAYSLDARMIAAMPPSWRLYYRAAAAKTAYQPVQPGLVSLSSVDRTPHLLTRLDAPSNQYAQECGVAGMALYRAVIGAGGTPETVAIVRPIGFGLDENAVTAIHNARFEPAMKDGKPVLVSLDMIVEFRIYSKRTAANSASIANASAKSALPGPYTIADR